MNNTALATILQKLNTSYTIWLVVGICQIVFGFWYVTPIFFGAWNIYCAEEAGRAFQAGSDRTCRDCQELEGQYRRIHYP